MTVYACDPHAFVLADDVNVNDVPVCAETLATIAPLQPVPLICEPLTAASVNVL